MPVIGLDNITNTTIVENNMSTTADLIGNTIPSEAFGLTSFVGIFIMALFGLVFWKADVKADTSASVMIPMSMFLAYYGWLPFGDGIIFSVIIGVSGLIVFGFMKYFG